MFLFTAGTYGDDWSGPDKAKHFAVSALLGSAAYAYTDDRTKAFGLAMIPGVIKEIADSQSDGNSFSGKDLVWNAIGAGFGVQIGHWVIGPGEINFTMAF